MGALVLMGVFALTVLTIALLPSLPSLQSIHASPLKVPLRIYSADGTLLAEYGEEKRILVHVPDVPKPLIQAILAAEDDAFYAHHGVDFSGIARAIVANLRAGRSAEGASTITMQVARNYFLTPEKTLKRKFREILLAFRIEREFSKDQILEMYLNKIFLGQHAYGFAAASQIYFGKDLAELGLPEMALLAGLPKAPSRLNPIANPSLALARRAYVLKRMHDLGHIDEQTLFTATRTPLAARRHAVAYGLDAPYVAEMVRQYLYTKYAESTYEGGFHVYTSLRDRHQLAANRALERTLIDYDRRHGWRGAVGHEEINSRTPVEQMDEALRDYPIHGRLLPAVVTHVQARDIQIYMQDGRRVTIDWNGLSWAARYLNENAVAPAPITAGEIVARGDVIHVSEDGGQFRLAQVPAVSGAFVALDPKDGAVLALTGGFDFHQSNFNRAIQAERQPGSSIKPFIFAAALEKGYTPASLVSGAPIVIEDVSLEEEWRPQDFSNEFHGPTRLRKALALSLNLVSVRLLRAIGPDYAAATLARFGFDPSKTPQNLSLALGSAEVTPLALTRAYAVFANGGYRIDPWFIQRIEDSGHNVLEQAKPVAVGTQTPNQAEPTQAEQVLQPGHAFLIAHMMRDVILYGTAQAAITLNRKDIAGKTGTTNDHRDAWFSGFQADVTATAWVGFDQPKSLGRAETGGHTALPMWIDYMREVLAGVPEKSLDRPPSGIVSALINRTTGQLTDRRDPEAMSEYFMEGQLPAAESSPGTPGAGGESGEQLF